MGSAIGTMPPRQASVRMTGLSRDELNLSAPLSDTEYTTQEPVTGTYTEQLRFKWGDINGFVQLFFDNVATLLTLIFFMEQVFRGFNNEKLLSAESGDFAAELSIVDANVDRLIYQRAIPGLAMTMVFGNVYYSWMAVRLGRRENRRGKVTALPYGINTPGSFAFIFGIIGPAAAKAGAACADLPVTSSQEATAFATCWVGASNAGWQAGVVANVVSGLFCLGMALMGSYLLNITPAVALLTALAGIGFSFLGFVQIANNFAEPVAGLLPLFLTFILYFGDITVPSWLPKSLIIATTGILLGWIDGVATVEDVRASTDLIRFWGVKGGGEALSDWSSVDEFMGTIFPVSLAAASGTLMNVLSAQQAGDQYGVMETMLSDGIGTCVGALFGTPFGTSVYIGFPAYKKMGAGVMYSLLNCVVFFLFALFGVFALVQACVPILAVAPLILFVGILICQEAIAAAPVRQYPAFLIGLFPSVCDWSLTAGVGFSSVGGPSWYGLVALKPGAIFLSLILSTVTCFIIDRDFAQAAAWLIVAAFFSAFGVIHQNEAVVKNWRQPQALYCEFYSLPPGASCPEGYASCSKLGSPSCATVSTVKWRFMLAYLMCALLCGLFCLGQKFGYVDNTITEEQLREEEAETKKSLVRNVEAKAHVGEATQNRMRRTSRSVKVVPIEGEEDEDETNHTGRRYGTTDS